MRHTPLETLAMIIAHLSITQKNCKFVCHLQRNGRKHHVFERCGQGKVGKKKRKLFPRPTPEVHHTWQEKMMRHSCLQRHIISSLTSRINTIDQKTLPNASVISKRILWLTVSKVALRSSRTRINIYFPSLLPVVCCFQYKCFSSWLF